MYFENRSQAGQILAAELLEKYRYEDCAVVALTDGAVIVGEQIAAALHCILTMLLIEDIEIPGEGMSFGGVSQDGAFTYNGMFSAGEIEQYTSEFHGYLEEQKRISFQKLNRLLGDGGLINNDMLRDRIVILVSDGLDSGASLDVAVDFLKPIRIKRLVVASPVATVQSVDKLHMLADELHILSVKDNYLGVNHYYNQNDIPSHEDTIAKINQIVLNWR
ncbi:MAG TPA: phosphoribosyltransferase family protein [Candidatus Saccharibacteria bacterium]|mgnify:FL=1|nr:phosphoribosyltransferase family protein [Candidatus Saccharibacteria bacterium]HRQ97796.1 phosphoribosyltransferase family protein [Candidatus Saccharibacteria bacterium]